MPDFIYSKVLYMQVGETGLGKTTFIQNLHAALQPDAPAPPVHAEPNSAHEVFEVNPDLLTTEVIIQNGHVRCHYLLQVCQLLQQISCMPTLVGWSTFLAPLVSLATPVSLEPTCVSGTTCVLGTPCVPCTTCVPCNNSSLAPPVSLAPTYVSSDAC